MGLIYYLSSFHSLIASEVSWQDFVIRKTAHFTEYLVLFLLSYQSLKNTIDINKNKLLAMVLLFTIIYAFSDELHQTFVLGRSGRFFDIGIDSLGTLSGLVLIKFLPKNFTKLIT